MSDAPEWGEEDAQSFEKDPTAMLFADKTVSLMLDTTWWSPELRILDYGCGTGFNTMKLAEKLKEGSICAVDVSEPMLSKLHDKLATSGTEISQKVKTQVIGPDASDITGKFDVVLAAYVLHHASKYMGDIVKNLATLLESEGRFCILEFFDTAKTRAAREEMQTRYQSKGHGHHGAGRHGAGADQEGEGEPQPHRVHDIHIACPANICELLEMSGLLIETNSSFSVNVSSEQIMDCVFIVGRRDGGAASV